MNRTALRIAAGGLIVALTGLPAMAEIEETLISRPDLCKADFPVQELEGVTWLATTWVDDHFIGCSWQPALDFGANRPARQPRRADCVDGMAAWSVDIVFERAPNGALRLTSADDRLPRKTYAPCPQGYDRPLGGQERFLNPQPDAAEKAQ